MNDGLINFQAEMALYIKVTNCNIVFNITGPYWIEKVHLSKDRMGEMQNKNTPFKK